MNLEDEFELEHLLLTQRKCRVCNTTKDLLDNFYLTRRDRGHLPSAYSYECKMCTIKRVSNSRIIDSTRYEYPDW
jgi:hypothetical protein